jgi:hypothetical protein
LNLAEAEEKGGFKIKLPSWWLKEDFRRDKMMKIGTNTQIGALPTQTQESELVKDVVSLLSGKNGENNIFLLLSYASKRTKRGVKIVVRKKM